MSYDWNPYKDKNSLPLHHPPADWNFDFRDQSYYLGQIHEGGDNDLSMRYYTDEKTGRYYRNSEVRRKEEPAMIDEKPFLNNCYEGERKMNFSFAPPEKVEAKK